MQCHQARQLFDAYLDGELSPSLATELGAHRLSCSDCRQALALLEVSGHILRSDRDPVQAPDDFTDRLLACVDPAPVWRKRVFSTLYIGGPLAAAAVIALAFIGAFDRNGPSQVAGVKEIAPATMVQAAQPPPKATAASTVESVDPAEQALTEFFDKTQQRVNDQGQSVQKVFDLTILQMLDILEEAKDRSQARPTPWNGIDAASPNPENAEPAGAEDFSIEDADEEFEPETDDSEPPRDPQDEE